MLLPAKELLGMNRIFCLLAAVLLLASMSACGGGGSAPVNTGLTPLDFDVTTDGTSTVGADDVIGYAVERTNPMFAAAETKVPAGYALAALLVFEPETAAGAGFSGDFTVRTPDRSVSVTQGNSFGQVYRGIWDSRSQVWSALRTGFYAHGTGGGFKFHLDYLGIVMLLKPTGSQFQVAAFADLATAPVSTDVNFWVLQRNGVEPVNYHWDFGDGTTAAGAEVTHNYPLIGDYNVTITATDGAGNVAPVASTPISITGNPVPLTAVTLTVTPPAAGSSEFQLSATANGGTAPFTYEWDFDSDGITDIVAGATVSYQPTQAGVGKATVRVSDQTGASATDDDFIDSRTISLAVSSNPAYVDHEVEFTVTTAGTDASDVIELEYGDGTTGTALKRTYTLVSTFPCRAKVTRFVQGQTVTKFSDVLLLDVLARPAPVLDSVTPARAAIGATVTLTGNFFFLPEVDDEVLLGQMPMPVVTWTPTAIEVTVPPGGRDGDITVRKAHGSGQVSNPLPFDVAPTPPGQPGTGQL
jgi:PKD repeat protein